MYFGFCDGSAMRWAAARRIASPVGVEEPSGDVARIACRTASALSSAIGTSILDVTLPAAHEAVLSPPSGKVFSPQRIGAVLVASASSNGGTVRSHFGNVVATSSGGSCIDAERSKRMSTSAVRVSHPPLPADPELPPSPLAPPVPPLPSVPLAPPVAPSSPAAPASPSAPADD